MIPTACSCQQLQRFLQQLNDRVGSMEASLASVAGRVEEHCPRSDLDVFKSAVEPRLAALERSLERVEAALVLPDDLQRCVAGGGGGGSPALWVPRWRRDPTRV